MDFNMHQIIVISYCVISVVVVEYSNNNNNNNHPNINNT